MRKVSFPLNKEGNMVVYPDDISMFHNAGIVGDIVIAEYFGAMPLEDYIEPEPEHVYISEWRLRNLFTLDEQLSFDNFEESETLTVAQKQMIRTITKNLAAVKDKEVDLKDPATIFAMTTLEAYGILNEGHAAEVLAYRP